MKLFAHAEPKTAGLPPNASYLYCPICGVVIHGYSHNDLRHPADIADLVELFAVEHFRRHHPRRWWLYRRTGWKRLIAGWPL